MAGIGVAGQKMNGDDWIGWIGCDLFSLQNTTKQYMGEGAVKCWHSGWMGTMPSSAIIYCSLPKFLSNEFFFTERLVAYCRADDKVVLGDNDGIGKLS